MILFLQNWYLNIGNISTYDLPRVSNTHILTEKTKNQCSHFFENKHAIKNRIDNSNIIFSSRPLYFLMQGWMDDTRPQRL